MGPGNTVLLGIGLNVALKVDVVALLDFVRIQCGAQGQRHLWGVCNKERYGMITGTLVTSFDW